MSLKPAIFIFAAIGCTSAASAQPAEWRFDRTVDDMKVELRNVAGSQFQEVRVSTFSTLPLVALCDAVWGKDARVDGSFKKRVVIRETESERWTYEQVRVPLVKDRDYVMLVRRVAPAESGRCEIVFETRSDPGYPVRRDHVRIPVVRGRWTLDPVPDGRTSIAYQIYSEPGGMVPAVFARGGQCSAAVDFMKTILARATQ